MSLTAATLSKTGARGHDIETIVRDQLAVIDTKLQHSEKSWGRNVVLYDLPTSFNMPGLVKADAQLVIYSSIIQSLRKRGFDVKILIESESTLIAIAWETVLSEVEVDAMSRVISDTRVDRKTLDAFCKRGGKKSRSTEPGKSASRSASATNGAGGRRAAAGGAAKEGPAAALPSWAAGSGSSPPPPARADGAS